MNKFGSVIKVLRDKKRNLEIKFERYLYSKNYKLFVCDGEGHIKEIAHKLAEIAEKDYEFKCSECDIYKEKQALKKQLSNQKYLSYKEVNKAIFDNHTIPGIFVDDEGIHKTGFMELNIDKAVTAICSLAISKERIIEVLEKDRRGKYVVGTHKQIANEILGDDKDE